MLRPLTHGKTMYFKLFPLATALMAIAAIGSVASAQSIGESAVYGEVRLRNGFVPDPHEIDLMAEGGVKVKEAACQYGYVSEAPDLDFYYEGSGNRTLFIYASSDEDAILLLNDPSGEWSCDDDGKGDLDPLVVIPNAPPGLYNIWVGRYGDAGGPATLSISELAPRAGE